MVTLAIGAQWFGLKIVSSYVHGSASIGDDWSNFEVKTQIDYYYYQHFQMLHSVGAFDCYFDWWIILTWQCSPQNLLTLVSVSSECEMIDAQRSFT